MAGWVYVMTNVDLPGRVKVGYTERHPYARLQELDQAGLPHAHVMAYAAWVAEPYQLEQRVHRALAACHYNKEWFTCGVDDATATIQEYAGLIEREMINGRESPRLPIPKKPVAPPPPAQPETVTLPEEPAEDVPITFWGQLGLFLLILVLIPFLPILNVVRSSDCRWWHVLLATLVWGTILVSLLYGLWMVFQ